jgi:hypothetical protein
MNPKLYFTFTYYEFTVFLIFVLLKFTKSVLSDQKSFSVNNMHSVIVQ